jgi:hypothetical protein
MIVTIVMVGIGALFISSLAFAMLANEWATRRIFPFVIGTICLIACGKMLLLANQSMAWLALTALALAITFRFIDSRCYGSRR